MAGMTSSVSGPLGDDLVAAGRQFLAEGVASMVARLSLMR